MIDDTIIVQRGSPTTHMEGKRRSIRSYATHEGARTLVVIPKDGSVLGGVSSPSRQHTHKTRQDAVFSHVRVRLSVHDTRVIVRRRSPTALLRHDTTAPDARGTPHHLDGLRGG